MPIFTVETSYRVPVYRHRTYKADSLEDACRLAIEDDDWLSGRFDHDNAGKPHVSGVWEGENSAYRGKALPPPAHFAEAG